MEEIPRYTITITDQELIKRFCHMDDLYSVVWDMRENLRQSANHEKKGNNYYLKMFDTLNAMLYEKGIILDDLYS